VPSAAALQEQSQLDRDQSRRRLKRQEAGGSILWQDDVVHFTAAQIACRATISRKCSLGGRRRSGRMTRHFVAACLKADAAARHAWTADTEVARKICHRLPQPVHFNAPTHTHIRNRIHCRGLLAPVVKTMAGNGCMAKEIAPPDTAYWRRAATASPRISMPARAATFSTESTVHYIHLARVQASRGSDGASHQPFIYISSIASVLVVTKRARKRILVCRDLTARMQIACVPGQLRLRCGKRRVNGLIVQQIGADSRAGRTSPIRTELSGSAARIWTRHQKWIWMPPCFGDAIWDSRSRVPMRASDSTMSRCKRDPVLLYLANFFGGEDGRVDYTN
jgi:hypothetical protein